MIINKELKSKVIRFSGRSSDFIFPTILQGCFGGCKYCYASRHNPDDFYSNIKVSQNLAEIIDLVKSYKVKDITKPNQTHNKYITWDISCNSDIVPALHLFNWEKLFDYFKYSDRDFGTLATKFTNNKLLTYNANKKIRIRMSLMPSKLSDVLEPKTAKIINRIIFINNLYKAGYEVQINFSPVVFYKGWLEDYKELFKLIDSILDDNVKDQLACEVIFLTHNEQLHNYNEVLGKVGEKLLWQPKFQENKTSKFGGKNIRYKHLIKRELISKFKTLLNEELPYCKIRYIF